MSHFLGRGIETMDDGIQLALGLSRQVGTLGEVLAQQPILRLYPAL
jgi:hypothetical protein